MIPSTVVRAPALAALVVPAAAFAQNLPPTRTWEVPVGVDSGLITGSIGGKEARVAWSHVARASGADWVQVRLDGTELNGNLEIARGARLRIMSLADGATQWFDSVSLARHGGVSGVFNGDAVVIDLMSYGGEPASRARIKSLTAGEWVYEGAPDSICGPTDTRVLSEDPRTGRTWPRGCTAWMYNDQSRSFATAGHCFAANSSAWVQYNVPFSSSTGEPMHPPPEHQYVIAQNSVQFVENDIGDDWAVFVAFPNSTTGLLPIQAQGAFHVLAPFVPDPTPGSMARITGYGSVTAPVPMEWSQVLKTHAGEYVRREGFALHHRAHTTAGNSGSAIVDESTGLVIGVHTHGLCHAPVGANIGTAIDNPGWRAARATPIREAAWGLAPPVGRIHVTSDAMNHFGRVNPETGVFGTVSFMMPWVVGLAYDRDTATFIGVTKSRQLIAISPEGAVTPGPTLSGSAVISGLAYDPRSNRLYGSEELVGQLHHIDLSTGVLTPIGASALSFTGGIDFDPVRGVIWGVDDYFGGTRLMRINPQTGAKVFVGWLGVGIADCDGLAFDEESDTLITIDDATEIAYTINPQTGVATAIGPTRSKFDDAYGMAASTTRCTADFDRSGDLDIFDFLAFQNAIRDRDPRADMTGDLAYDLADFMAFQAAYAEGCP